MQEFKYQNGSIQAPEDCAICPLKDFCMTVADNILRRQGETAAQNIIRNEFLRNGAIQDVSRAHLSLHTAHPELPTGYCKDGRVICEGMTILDAYKIFEARIVQNSVDSYQTKGI